jgi:hypothetical protein
MVVASTVQNLFAASTVENLSGTNIPVGKFSHREYRLEFEQREHPRREFGGDEYREYRQGEYGERGGYSEYRD